MYDVFHVYDEYVVCGVCACACICVRACVCVCRCQGTPVEVGGQPRGVISHLPSLRELGIKLRPSGLFSKFFIH